MSDAPTQDDRNREAVAQRVLAGKYKASEDSMKEHAFNEEYRATRWFRAEDVWRVFEDTMGQIFCRGCMTKNKTGEVRAVRMHIAVESDPLGNAPAVTHLVCHNCAWEVYVNLARDPRKHPEWPNYTDEEIRKMVDKAQQEKSATEIRQRYMNVQQSIGRVGNAAQDQIRMVQELVRMGALDASQEAQYVEALRKQIEQEASMKVSPPIFARKIYDHRGG